MRIGIISDTHDNLVKIKESVKILNQKQVGFLLHCGDFIAPFSLNPLRDLKCDWAGVFGNNDGEKKGLQEKSQNKIKPAPYFLILGSQRIALTHELADYDADLIAFGHTHKVQVEKKGSRMFVNPGEAGGWVYGQSSLVILDLDNMQPEVVNF